MRENRIDVDLSFCNKFGAIGLPVLAKSLRADDSHLPA